MAKPDGNYNVEVTWLWRAAFRIITPEGKRVWLDPWLKDNPGCPPEYKDPDKVEADLVCFTHSGHSDHIGDTPAIASRTGATVICPSDSVNRLREEGVDAGQIKGMSYGGTWEAEGVKVSMVMATHVCPTFTVGLVLQFSTGLNLYHSGDTGIFSDMSYIRHRFHPQLALVNIGGFYTMDPTDASYACQEYLKPEWVVPMHYPGPMNVMTSNDLEEFEGLMTGSGIEVIGMKSGDTVRF